MALAVISLMQTLGQLMHPQHTDLRIYKLVKIFHNKLCILRDFLHNSCTDDVNAFETMITNSACKADEIIGSNLLDIRNQFNGATTRFPHELTNLIAEIDSVVKQVTTRVEKKKGKRVQQEKTAFPSSSYRDSYQTTAVVGLDDDFRMIKDRLRNPPDLQVVPIVGMGGIGKTTLAKTVYRDLSIVEHFHCCAWVTVSQEFQERQVYLAILRCLVSQFDELDNKSNEQLAEQVYKNLKGRRYLIVLDDVWSTKTWDHLRRVFPNDGKGSRILLTTRVVEVALYASSGRPPHHMSFLSIEQGWELLSGKVFGKLECYPTKLERIGKQIVFKCRGLPLAILIVAGLLSKVKKRINEWENVLENLNALVSTNAEDCFGILGLSYHHLPLHLKTCFVYTSLLFHEDTVIPVPILIKLWIAEGLVDELQGKGFEEVADTYLGELIDRNLVLISKRGSNGKPKTCMVHDLLRELCLREANTQKFLKLVMTSDVSVDIKYHTRFGFQSMKWEDTEKFLEHGSLNACRSILSLGMSYGLHFHENPNFGRFKLLRVLDASSVCFSHSGLMNDLKHLIYLRYISLSVSNPCPCLSIGHELQYLQTIVILNSNGSTLQFSTPVCQMPYLRHLQFGSGKIHYRLLSPNPNEVSFPSLQTLSGLRPSTCGVTLFRNIPNLKKLGIRYDDDTIGRPDCLASVHLLENLVALKFLYEGNIPYGKTVPQKLNLPYAFPLNLKKLTLLKSCLPWKDMTILASLPNLEVLKLKKHAFTGPEWETTEEGFQVLKVLVLELLDLVHWKASSDHFPSLQRLVIRHCYELEGIPCEFGDITTLQEIELDRSSLSVVDAAKEILEEQQNWGNHEFKLHFNSNLRICR